MKKKACFIILNFVVLFCLLYTKVSASEFNGWVLSTPNNVKLKISSTCTQFSESILESAKTWVENCPEIGGMQIEPNENIYFYGELNVDNGSYAVAYHNRNDYHSITVYSSFSSLASTEKRETIVHEVGHALGLAHCEKEYNSESVMRAKGFNQKAYPLKHDIKNIAKLY